MKLLLFTLILFATGSMAPSYAQDFPDQNKHYVLLNKGNNMALTFIKNAPFSDYPLLIGKVRIAAMGANDDEVKWKFNRLSADEPAYTIFSRNGGVCMDAYNDRDRYGRLKGYHFILHKPHGKDNQKFFLVPATEKNTFYIVAAHNGMLLELKKSPDANGINVRDIILQSKITGSDFQKWTFVAIE